MILAVITGICLLGDSSLYVLLPSRLDAFAVTPAGAGLILGINRYIRIVSNSGAGWVVQRTGIAWPVAFAVVLAAATTFVYGAMPGFWPLFIAHGLWGIAWSFLRLGGYLAAAETGDGRAIGRYMGVWQSLSRSGSLAAVLAGGLLADVIGADSTLVLFGALTLAGLVLLPFASIPKTLGRFAEQTSQAPLATSNADNSALKIRTLYAEGAITWLLVAGLFMGTAGYFVRTVTGDDGASFVGIVLGVSTIAGVVLGLRWAADLGLSPLLGHLSDRMGRPRMIVTSMAVAATAMLAVAVYPNLAVAIPMFGVVFVCGTALTVTLNASIAEMAPRGRRAIILSRYATWTDIGSGTGTIIGLPLVAGLGFGWTYALASALVSGAAIAYWAVFRGR